MVQSENIRPDFTAFGQTGWPTEVTSHVGLAVAVSPGHRAGADRNAAPLLPSNNGAGPRQRVRQEKWVETWAGRRLTGPPVHNTTSRTRVLLTRRFSDGLAQRKRSPLEHTEPRSVDTLFAETRLLPRHRFEGVAVDDSAVSRAVSARSLSGAFTVIRSRAWTFSETASGVNRSTGDQQPMFAAGSKPPAIESSPDRRPDLRPEQSTCGFRGSDQLPWIGSDVPVRSCGELSPCVPPSSSPSVPW